MTTTTRPTQLSTKPWFIVPLALILTLLVVLPAGVAQGQDRHHRSLAPKADDGAALALDGLAPAQIVQTANSHLQPLPSQTPPATPTPTPFPTPESLPGGWRSGKIDQDATILYRSSPITTDKVGSPHVSYSTYPQGLKYARLSSSGWQIEVVDQTGQDSALALDMHDLPHIAYEGRQGSGVNYAYVGASGWQTETLSNEGTLVGDRALILDQQDRPYVCFDEGELKVAMREATGWHIVTTVPGNTEHCGIAVDAAGQLFISYFNADASRFEIRFQVSGSWQVETVFATVDGEGTSLTLDSVGNPHIALVQQESGSPPMLGYAHRDSGHWQVDWIAEAYGRSAGVEIALDNQDQPHLLLNRFYAWRDAAAKSWHLATVPGCIAEQDSSLALDEMGRPHIACRSYGPGTLSYVTSPNLLSIGYWITQRLATPDQDFFFADANHGGCVAGGRLYRTTDGGVSWKETFGVGSQANFERVSHAFFVDDQEGWINGTWMVGDIDWGWFISHTSDGGVTWQDQIRRSHGHGGQLWFVDDRHGWEVTSSLVRHTADGGANWEVLVPNLPPYYSQLRLIRFVDTQVGFGIGESYAQPPSEAILLRTDDAGANWYQVSPLPPNTYEVWVGDDALHAWAVGAGGMASHSLDGGHTWIAASSGTTHDLHHVRFSGNRNGWAAGDHGTMLRSLDYGVTWFPQEVGTDANLTGLVVAEPFQAWVYGDRLYRTEVGGSHWYALPHTTGDVNSLHMTTTGVGWATTDSGILRTFNSGGVWTMLQDTQPALRTEAVDDRHAWALASDELQRTIDGGYTWDVLALPGIREARDLDFVDPQRGWMVGQADTTVGSCPDYDEQIYATTDGGLTWTPQIMTAQPWRCQNTELAQVVFVDQDHGWVAGRAGEHILFLSTDNGGATWQIVEWQESGELYDFDFADSNLGWRIRAVRDPLFGEAYVEWTEDGGASWQLTMRTPVWWTKSYRALDLLDDQEIWIVGEEGWILYSADGGLTWSESVHAPDLRLDDVHVAAAGQAWITGQNGLILRYSALEPSGCWATPTPAPTTTGTPSPNGTVDRQVAHCMDDAYVRVDTEELGYDTLFVRTGARQDGDIPYSAGMLFRDVPIPQGSEITAAHLELEPYGWQNGVPIEITLYGALQAQAGDFGPFGWQPQLRPRTQVGVSWTLSQTVTSTTGSPDLSVLIEEIVDQSRWQAGNNLAILIDRRPNSRYYIDWMANDRRPSDGARLVVSYQASGSPTATPTATSTNTPHTPTATATPSATLTPTAFPTPTAEPPTPTPTAGPERGSIAGRVWHDDNGDGVQQAGEPGLIGVTLNLRTGGVQIGSTTTLGDGSYSFIYLLPGPYQVREINPDWLPYSTTPDEVEVLVVAGQQVTADFGDWVGYRLWLPVMMRGE